MKAEMAKLSTATKNGVGCIMEVPESPGILHKIEIFGVRISNVKITSGTDCINLAFDDRKRSKIQERTAELGNSSLNGVFLRMNESVRQNLTRVKNKFWDIVALNVSKRHL
jgi:hypothetical protein